MKEVAAVKKIIYLDHHATTPCDPRVVEAMLPYFSERFGNAASREHRYGLEAAEAVAAARETIAHFIHAGPEEIIFTSGATEANNLAIKGVAEIYADKGNHLITAATEHKCVLEAARSLERKGWKVTRLAVDTQGLIRLDDLKKAITPKTVLISIMTANNEIGTIAPVAEIGKIARENGILFHTDAAQAVGKIPVDVQAMQIDLMSFSSHKIYGPKGVGALYVRKKNPHVRLAPLIDGGGHEGGLRSGTLNVPGIVGFGKAVEIASREMAEESRRIAALRDQLYDRISSELDEVYLNGHPTLRLPGNLNLSFSFVEAEALLEAIRDEIAVSSGAACTTTTQEPSYVLGALGVGPERMHTALRFGLGRFNTDEEVELAARKIITKVKRLRELSPVYQMVQLSRP